MRIKILKLMTNKLVFVSIIQIHPRFNKEFSHWLSMGISMRNTRLFQFSIGMRMWMYILLRVAQLSCDGGQVDRVTIQVWDSLGDNCSGGASGALAITLLSKKSCTLIKGYSFWPSGKRSILTHINLVHVSIYTHHNTHPAISSSPFKLLKYS